MRRRRKVLGLLASIAIILTVVAAWWLARDQRAGLGTLRVAIPAVCDRLAYESGDQDSASVVFYLAGSLDVPCLGIQRRSAPVEDLLALLREAHGSDPEATTDEHVSTPCGEAIRFRSQGTTTYLFAHDGQTWIIGYSVPDDTMPTCSFNR